ncbi:MAG: ImmA/IrrE family metallo-endopeptidase [Deltaproteobacteria bacterium]|nr:ImmA/IrrE family metallo-endopeptidase [Deltaproteobacteria bacterium]
MKFTTEILGKDFIEKVAYFSVLSDGPLQAREFLKNKGIKMVIVPHFKQTYLDGAALLNRKGEPIIAMSLRYNRLDNFWFTLAHELSHLVLGHVHDSEDQCIIDDLDLKNTKDEIENEADSLASESLISSLLWNDHPARRTCDPIHILDLASKADIHPSIIAGRIRRENNNYKILSSLVGNGMVRKLFLN